MQGAFPILGWCLPTTAQPDGWMKPARKGAGAGLSKVDRSAYPVVHHVNRAMHAGEELRDRAGFGGQDAEYAGALSDEALPSAVEYDARVEVPVAR
jgi:hypothetical protein